MRARSPCFILVHVLTPFPQTMSLDNIHVAARSSAQHVEGEKSMKTISDEKKRKTEKGFEGKKSQTENKPAHRNHVLRCHVVKVTSLDRTSRELSNASTFSSNESVDRRIFEVEVRYVSELPYLQRY
jgi:hypothetical protein